MYCKKYGYILESLDIEELKLCRNEKDLRKYLKAKGINLTRAQACELKVFYSSNIKSSEMLNIETLNYVAGGMKARVKKQNKLLQEHFTPPAAPDVRHVVDEQQRQNDFLQKLVAPKEKIDKEVRSALPPLPPRPDEQHVRQLEQQVLKNQLLPDPTKAELTHQQKATKAAPPQLRTERTSDKNSSVTEHSQVTPKPNRQPSFASPAQTETTVRVRWPEAKEQNEMAMRIKLPTAPLSKNSNLRFPKQTTHQPKPNAQAARSDAITLGKVGGKHEAQTIETQPVNKPKVEPQLEQNRADAVKEKFVLPHEDDSQVQVDLGLEPKLQVKNGHAIIDTRDPEDFISKVTTESAQTEHLVQPSEKVEQIGEAAASAATHSILVDNVPDEKDIDPNSGFAALYGIGAENIGEEESVVDAKPKDIPQTSAAVGQDEDVQQLKQISNDQLVRYYREHVNEIGEEPRKLFLNAFKGCEDIWEGDKLAERNFEDFFTILSEVCKNKTKGESFVLGITYRDLYKILNGEQGSILNISGKKYSFRDFLTSFLLKNSSIVIDKQFAEYLMVTFHDEFANFVVNKIMGNYGLIPCGSSFFETILVSFGINAVKTEHIKYFNDGCNCLSDITKFIARNLDLETYLKSASEFFSKCVEIANNYGLDENKLSFRAGGRGFTNPGLLYKVVGIISACERYKTRGIKVEHLVEGQSIENWIEVHSQKLANVVVPTDPEFKDIIKIINIKHILDKVPNDRRLNLIFRSSDILHFSANFESGTDKRTFLVKQSLNAIDSLEGISDNDKNELKMAYVKLIDEKETVFDIFRTHFGNGTIEQFNSIDPFEVMKKHGIINNEGSDQKAIFIDGIENVVTDSIARAIMFGWNGETSLEGEAVRKLGIHNFDNIEQEQAAEYLVLNHEDLSPELREGLACYALDQAKRLEMQIKKILDEHTKLAKGKPIEGLVCHADQLWKIVKDAETNRTESVLELVECDPPVLKDEDGKLSYQKNGQRIDCTNNAFEINGMYYRFFDEGKDKQSNLKLVSLKRYETESEMPIDSSDPVYLQDKVMNSHLTGSFTVKYPNGDIKILVPYEGRLRELPTGLTVPNDYIRLIREKNNQHNHIVDRIPVVQQLQKTIAPLAKQQTDQEREAKRLLNNPDKKLSLEERTLLENFVSRRTQILKIQWELDRKEYEVLKEEASTLLGFNSKQEYDVLWEKLFKLIPPLKWRKVNKSITESDSQKLKQYTEIYDRLNYFEMQRLGIEYSEKQDAKAINLLPSTKEKKQLIACGVVLGLGGTAIITTIVLASLGIFGGAGAPFIPLPIVGSTNNGNNDNNNDNKNNAA